MLHTLHVPNSNCKLLLDYLKNFLCQKYTICLDQKFFVQKPFRHLKNSLKKCTMQQILNLIRFLLLFSWCSFPNTSFISVYLCFRKILFLNMVSVFLVTTCRSFYCYGLFKLSFMWRQGYCFR